MVSEIKKLGVSNYDSSGWASHVMYWVIISQWINFACIWHKQIAIKESCVGKLKAEPQRLIGSFFLKLNLYIFCTMLFSNSYSIFDNFLIPFQIFFSILFLFRPIQEVDLISCAYWTDISCKITHWLSSAGTGVRPLNYIVDVLCAVKEIQRTN